MNQETEATSTGIPLHKYHVIHLDSQADVVAAIEALRYSQPTNLQLVLPNNSRFFQDSFVLSLLKEIAGILQKDFVLVTKDQLIVNLATKLEIKTASEIIKAPVKTEPDQNKKVATSAKKTPKSPANVRKSTTFKSPVTDMSPVEAATSLNKPVKDTGVSSKTSPQRQRLTPTTSSSASLAPASIPSLANNPGRKRGKTALIFLIAILLVAAVAIGFYLFYPKTAVITIEAEVSDVSKDMEAIFNISLSQVDLDNDVLPLHMVRLEKLSEYEITSNGSVQGAKANGTIDVFNCNPDEELVIDDSITFLKNDLEYVIVGDLEITISPATDQETCAGGEISDNVRSVRIEATEIGEEYNQEGGSYQISGIDISEEDYNVIGGQITGGTDDSSCVTEADLEEAYRIFSEIRNDSSVKEELQQKITEDDRQLIAMPDTFQIADDEIVEPELCPIISDNTLKQVLVYYMGGVLEADMAKLTAKYLTDGNEELAVLNNGLSSATYEVYPPQDLNRALPQATLEDPADIRYRVIINVKDAQVGRILEEEEIVQQAAGRRSKTIGAELRQSQGVRSVRIELSPFWAFWLSDLPTDVNKIDIVVENNATEDN